GAQNECPLLAELDAIGTLNSESAILIDDARLFLAPPPPPHDAEQWPLIDEVVLRLRSLAETHATWVINDVLVFAPRHARQPGVAHGRAHGIELQRVYSAAVAGATEHRAVDATPATTSGATRGRRPTGPITGGFNVELLGHDKSERIFAHHLERLGI